MNKEKKQAVITFVMNHFNNTEKDLELARQAYSKGEITHYILDENNQVMCTKLVDEDLLYKLDEQIFSSRGNNI